MAEQILKYYGRTKYSTELTPFIRKKPTRTCCISIPVTVIFVIIAIFCITLAISEAVSFSQRETNTNNKTASFIERRTEVSIILEPDEIYHLEVLNEYNTKDEWIDYHSQIIEKQRYDPTDESVIYIFTVHDYNYDKEYYYKKYGFSDDTEDKDHHDSTPSKKEPKTRRSTTGKTSKKGKEHNTNEDTTTTTDKIQTGGLRCYFRYALNENLNDIDHPLTCSNAADTLVGCVGGSTNRATDIRSGEKAIEGNGCVANGESLYIRCCHPDKHYEHITMTGKVSHIEHHPDPNYPSYTTNDFCQSTDLEGFAHEFNNENYYMVGCTGWMGSHDDEFDKTESRRVIGTKIVETETGETMCKSHRGDKGFIAAAAIVVNLKGGEFECVTVETNSSRIPDKYSENYIRKNKGKEPIFGSMLFCPHGYNLMDCSGFTDEIMDQCGRPSETIDRVSAAVFHGGDLICMTDHGPHCSANGYTDKIRVQARCCRIKERGPHSDELD